MLNFEPFQAEIFFRLNWFDASTGGRTINFGIGALQYKVMLQYHCASQFNKKLGRFYSF